MAPDDYPPPFCRGPDPEPAACQRLEVHFEICVTGGSVGLILGWPNTFVGKKKMVDARGGQMSEPMWSETIVSGFRHNGLVVVRSLFAPSDVIRMRHDLKSLQAAMSAPTAPLHRVEKSRFFTGRIPGPLGEIWRDPRLVSFPRVIFGPDIALYMNRLMIKDEAYGASVTPHQDFPYFHGGPRKISTFVFLGPCNDRNGGLAFAPGTHLYGPIGKRGNLDLEAFGVARYVTPALEAGDVIFADFLIWHWSWDAIEPVERPMLQIVYQPADDGSFHDETVEVPTLVSGTWGTERFVPFATCVTDQNTTPVKNLSMDPAPFTVTFDAGFKGQ